MNKPDSVIESPGPAAPPASLTRRLAKRFGEHPEVLPLILFVLAVVLFWSLNSAFLSGLNISGMLAYAPELGIVALGMTLLLTAGQFDLSVGAVFGFCPLIVFILANDHGVPFPAAVAVGLLCGACIGLVNGLLVVKGGITSFLVTLSTQLIVSGGALYVSSGFPQSTLSVHSAVQTALVGTIQVGSITIYAGLLWFVGIAIVFAYMLNHTPVGNWIMATGGNVEAARARGIRTDRVTIGLFVLTAVLAGFAGTISDIRVGSAYPDAGSGYELEAIAMAVVGGTSLFGGSGTIVGTVLGALLLRAIRNGVILVGVPGLAYNMFVGAIILIAMLLHSGMRRVQLIRGRTKA
jgi:simple sugar transport system permease protein